MLFNMLRRVGVLLLMVPLVGQLTLTSDLKSGRITR